MADQNNNRRPTMNHSQFTKFSPITVLVKRTIKKLRVDAGYSMNEGARLLGVSRKQLEDIETIRNYGCHLDLELLAKMPSNIRWEDLSFYETEDGTSTNATLACTSDGNCEIVDISA